MKMTRECKNSRVFLCKKEDDANSGYNLKGQNYRQTDIELGMLGFVAEKIHAGDGTDTAADGGNCHEGCFRDAPEISSGFDLVHKHKQEACGID